MKIQLLKGRFKAEEAIDLLSQFIQVKIKYHELQIADSHNEEDIKMRETRIKQLQQDLADAKNEIRLKNSYCELESEITIL